MRKIVVIAFLLSLSGCTSDHYTPVDYGMNDALKECRHNTFKKYYDAHANDDKTGVVAGGVLLGPIGAVLGDSIANSGNTLPKLDLNVEMENCMKAKGYTGTSEHYN